MFSSLRAIARAGAALTAALAVTVTAASGAEAAPHSLRASSYTGLAFDACSAPSSSAIQAWSSSPFRALNIYIGGVNSACSQPNLTASWVTAVTGMGWRLIPTYVGLQAPSNNCGCAAIIPGHAKAEGIAAAVNAVSLMSSLGIGAGNPIYDDMEGYTVGSTNSKYVLQFLLGWTTKLHALGYIAGVYSSVGSGISDLVKKYATTYVEPDDIWFANWNGVQSTADSAIPAADWATHQRIHQYSGAHNDTYGGVTINVDSDYSDGAVVTS
jgi:hypothetical protein